MSGTVPSFPAHSAGRHEGAARVHELPAEELRAARPAGRRGGRARLPAPAGPDHGRGRLAALLLPAAAAHRKPPRAGRARVRPGPCAPSQHSRVALPASLSGVRSRGGRLGGGWTCGSKPSLSVCGELPQGSETARVRAGPCGQRHASEDAALGRALGARGDALGPCEVVPSCFAFFILRPGSSPLRPALQIQRGGEGRGGPMAPFHTPRRPGPGPGSWQQHSLLQSL